MNQHLQCCSEGKKKKGVILTSPLLADELLLTEDDLWPILGVPKGETVVPFTAATFDVPLLLTATLEPAVPDDEDALLVVLTADERVDPLASLNCSANW